MMADDKRLNLRGIDTEEARQNAKLCGFSTVAEYVRWAIKNGPRLMGLEVKNDKRKGEI